MYALCPDVDFAFVAGSVEAAKPRVGNETPGGLLRQVSVTARNVHSTDAEFSDLPMGKWTELVILKDDVSDVGERSTDGDRFPWPQAMPARIRARLCWAVGVDDLPSASSPGLYERAGERFAVRLVGERAALIAAGMV